MSPDLINNFMNEMCLEIMYLITSYEEDLAINNLE